MSTKYDILAYNFAFLQAFNSLYQYLPLIAIIFFEETPRAVEPTRAISSARSTLELDY